jgi:cytochrome c peroxidase
VGGASIQKLGLAEPYPAQDLGRFAVTGIESDRMKFRVPSLRNVAETGPWFHDGSVEKIEGAVKAMARHQLGLTLDARQMEDVLAFLKLLTGAPTERYIARPELPFSTPATPRADPN